MQKFTLFLLMVIGWGILSAQSLSPDNVAGAKSLLEQARTELNAGENIPLSKKAAEMIRLGLWEEATLLLSAKSLSTDLSLQKAELLILQNRFFEAENILKRVSKKAGASEKWEALSIRLLIEAWKLAEAENSCIQYLQENPKAENIVLLLGKIYVLQKNFPKALALSRQVQEWNKDNAKAYLLEAEALLWQREQAPAELALKRCLELDPFNADARFYYGYAIWRRVDATQLPDMAAQWSLALEIDPLHYLTHWHWGNGHTQLTYADYAQEEDEEVRKLLKAANQALGENNSKQAISIARDVENQYPQSVIAPLFRASTYYLLQESDSAEQLFLHILEKKPNYGPAHNGLAALIKQRRFPYLQYSDSVEKRIKQTRIQDKDLFFKIFPDLAFYPGERVSKMVYQQLYTGIVYLPFLEKLQRKFVIPPLHTDLAEAMGNLYFRGGTTFDNRQWMDIRGVGSGATGIEYVERGAHLERNVTLHEYVHLFHGSIFTDDELREVRKRYYYAMENGCTLDYYGANNEFEYLAQAFPAYFIPIKVHPLNHKSMNTQSDLKSKDPLMYAFVEKLVNKHKEYLDGNTQAMAPNWANVYLQLARQAGRWGSPEKQNQHLKTAWDWDSTYIPVYLGYAQTYMDRFQFDSAKTWLDKALDVNPSYAPTYQKLAQWENSRFERGAIEELQTVKAQKSHYGKASKLESDIGLLASLNREIRQFYRSYGLISEAIETADTYVASAPSISTYLRDSKDAAAAFAFEQKGLLGYAEESLVFFKELVAQKPQNYRHRLQYARILTRNGKTKQALEVLEEGNRILSASGNTNSDYLTMIAENYLTQGDTLSAKNTLAPVLSKEVRNRSNPYQWIRLLIGIGEIEQAEERFKKLEVPRIPFEKSEYLYTAAQLELNRGNLGLAQITLQAAIKSNIYHVPARLQLLDLLEPEKDFYLIRKLATEGTLLPIPPGPFIMEKMKTYLVE